MSYMRLPLQGRRTSESISAYLSCDVALGFEAAEHACPQRTVLLVHDHDAIAAAFFRGVKRLIGQLNETECAAAFDGRYARAADADGHERTHRRCGMGNRFGDDSGTKLFGEFIHRLPIDA